MTRIILITDAWHPQVNGVVRVLSSLRKELLAQGHEVDVVEPSLFSAFPLPWYPEIKMTYHISRSALRRFIEPPCVVHIATEFAIGLWFRHACEKYDIPFTTSYHTDFPAYCKKYIGIPQRLSYSYLRWFHRPAQSVLVSTPTMQNTLVRRGFKNVELWTKGVDADFFRPRPSVLPKGEKPVCMYVGRVAKEKNIEAFLKVSNDVRKVVVGDGPYLSRLQKKYGEVQFIGKLEGERLAEMYASADCFVFPSKTDTLGMVLLEALASGVPVAAYPVQGPIDVVTNPSLGCLNVDLEKAIATALARGDRTACRAYALKHTWKRCADEFLAAQVPYTA